MDKNRILNFLKIITLGLILSFGFSFVSAQWAPPIPASSTSNTPAPINVGSTPQVKDGNLSVNAFLATLNSQFNENLSIKQNLFAHKLESRGSLVLTNFEAYNDPNNPMAKFINTAFAQTASTNRTLCVDYSGNVILCAKADCGSSHLGFFPTAPDTDLCDIGSTQIGLVITNNTQPNFSWTCNNGNTNTSCYAFGEPATCGIAHTSYIDLTVPSANLCGIGSSLVGSIVTNSTSPNFTWTCANSISSVSCFANLPATCGSANGGIFSSTPSTNLCGNNSALSTAGVSLQGGGVFNWNCEKGSSSATCAAYHKLNSATLYYQKVGCLTQVPTAPQGILYSFEVHPSATPPAISFPTEWTILDLDNNNAVVYQATLGDYFGISKTPNIRLDASKFLNKRDYRITAKIKYGAPSFWITKTMDLETDKCD